MKKNAKHSVSKKHFLEVLQNRLGVYFTREIYQGKRMWVGSNRKRFESFRELADEYWNVVNHGAGKSKSELQAEEKQNVK